jgi:hypothetical protein
VRAGGTYTWSWASNIRIRLRDSLYVQVLFLPDIPKTTVLASRDWEKLVRLFSLR